MAAIAPPIVPAGAPAPTVVTVTGKIPLNDPATRNHASTVSAFTFALTGVAFSRILTELAASGLLNAGPFEYQRDSDAALCALTAVNPANLAIQLIDFFK